MRRIRIRPYWLAIAAGVGLAIVLIGSDTAASILKWHDHSPVQREVFRDIPYPLQTLFYTVLSILFLAVGYLFALRVKNWSRGQPDDRSTTKKNFERRVNDAVEMGAKLLHGNDRQGALYPPTVVDHVPPEAELVHEETFGLIIPIIRCPDDMGEVIRISNSTAYGLSSGVCTNRLDYITRFINELQVGTVNVWEVPGYRIEMSPFGGIKDSGLGYKEGVVEAMKSFTNVKTYSLPWPA